VAEKPNPADVCQRRDRAPGLQSCSNISIDDKTIYPYNLMYQKSQRTQAGATATRIIHDYFQNPAIREARWLLIKT
jgi:hypothetical protein